MQRRALLCLALLVSLAQCTSLQPISANSCGNGVVEPGAGEDCDTFAQFPNATCRASGTTGQCRYDCTPSKDAAKPAAQCPPGWGCGTDSICREPSGVIDQTSTAPIAAGAWRVKTGDFNGDGLADALTITTPDALAESKVRAHYFDKNLNLVDVVPVGPAMSSQLVMDVNGDKRADLTGTLFAAGFLGIDVLLGGADRSLTPVAYPAFDFQGGTGRALMTTDYTNPFVEQVAILLQTDGSPMDVVTTGTNSAQRSTITQFPHGLLAGDSFSTSYHVAGDAGLAVAHFDLKAPCDQYVVAYADEAKVYVVQPCKEDYSAYTWLSNITPISVALPAGAKVERGVRVADLNGDGKLDLMIGARDPASHTYVAYGDGAMGFFPAPELTGTPNTTALYQLPNIAMPPPVDGGVEEAGTRDAGRQLVNNCIMRTTGDAHIELPLAVADLNNDALPDFVEPQFVWMSINDGMGTYETANCRLSGAWSEAVIADFNLDGRLDFAASSDTELEIDVFLNVGINQLNTFPITTNGDVSHLALGDYDGDQVPDLAFSQALSPVESQVAIAFGRPLAPPGPPVAVGTFYGSVHQAAPIVGYGPPSSLVLEYGSWPKTPSACTQASPGCSDTLVALLAGNGARQPLAALQLSTSGGGKSADALVVTGGHFVKASTVPDLAALGGDLSAASRMRGMPVFQPWLEKSTGLATDKTPNFRTGVAAEDLMGAQPFEEAPDGSGRVAMLLTSGDVDNDGLDELVLLMPAAMNSGHTFLLVAHPNETASWTSTNVELPYFVSTTGQVDLVDLDGDGFRDLIFLTGHTRAARNLVVFWNDKTGGFDPARSLVVESEQDNANVEGFTTLALNVGSPRALAYVSGDPPTNPGKGVTLAQIDATRAVVQTLSFGDTQLYRTGIASGDVNGDGVEDLAVIQGQALVINRGTPVRP